MIRLTLLGTGSAGGLPVYGCDCKACERATSEPGFVRRQCSAEVQLNDVRLLVDAGLSDLPERYPPGSLNGLLLTHYHVDHVQGLFHWRWGKSDTIKVYGPDDPEGCADLLKHPGLFDFNSTFTAFQSLEFSGVEQTLTVTPLPLTHSKPVFGYCLQTGQACKLAYLTDTVGLPEQTFDWMLRNKVTTAVLDCTHPPSNKRPRNHNDLNMVLELFDKFFENGLPVKIILTHISHELDCWLLEHPNTLPDGVSVAKDGDVIEV